jgi:hypothetical protein
MCASAVVEYLGIHDIKAQPSLTRGILQDAGICMHRRPLESLRERCIASSESRLPRHFDACDNLASGIPKQHRRLLSRRGWKQPESRGTR